MCGLPGKSGEPALFCHFLIHSQTTTPCQAREFLSRKGFGRGCPFPPQKTPSSLWIKAFHIWSNIRSWRFLVHPDKPLILATICPQPPRQLLPFLHTQPSGCQNL